MRNLLKHRAGLQARSILITPFVLMITAYQHTLSPDHGPLKYLYPYGYCRHSPTCSQYAKEQLEKRGLVIGGFLAIRRVFSCNPFTKISDAKWREMAKRQISS
jgi:putative membrane protein insertion efficiency factor